MTYTDPGGQGQPPAVTSFSLSGLVNGLTNIANALSRIATVIGNSYISLAAANAFTGANTFSGSTTLTGPATFAGTTSITGATTFTKPVVEGTFTVGALGPATKGATAFVSDSTATLAAGLGNTVSGGGADFTPVYADGSNWRIG